MSHAGSGGLFLRDEGRRARASGLPPDLLAQSAERLRISALIYAFVFFMAGIVPAMSSAENRAWFLSHVTYWGPSTISILFALLVAGLIRSKRLPLARIMLIGLVFEVVSSYGIAAAEFLDPTGLDPATRVGLSWVAVWVLMFAVVVPNRPRQTAIATLASVSAVPVVLGYVIQTHPISGVTPQRFFFGLVFPYLLVALMAYIGSRLIHSLGREVTRARELGGYELIERLGGGGMGEVWRAEHHLLARPAAIKLVRPGLDGSDARRARELQDRFLREAQATALMRSPHTIELYDFGTTNDGTFYYVMELLDGFDLETLVNRFGPVPAERAIRMLRQVCHSLAEAHAKELIHRDIKPANVFVCRYGREVDYIKVLDFGMVKKRFVGDGNDDTQLTGDNMLAGTPAFMAPEQVLGNRPVDARTDLYAVGCVGYWLLTGQQVFSGKNAMSVLTQHAREAPPAPSAHTELEVPPALDALILACLAKNPDDRPVSAEALAEMLSAIETRSAWTPHHARDWWEKHHPVPAATV
ncbi:MAG TPA: serine/threonine-protein kinase [Candidatus Krumholzibacteria bacterium]|nr:serine/threonine-protein kinase [Candidatus Krumholzibacteria bacterium]